MFCSWGAIGCTARKYEYWDNWFVTVKEIRPRLLSATVRVALFLNYCRCIMLLVVCFKVLFLKKLDKLFPFSLRPQMLSFFSDPSSTALSKSATHRPLPSPPMKTTPMMTTTIWAGSTPMAKKQKWMSMQETIWEPCQGSWTRVETCFRDDFVFDDDGECGFCYWMVPRGSPTVPRRSIISNLLC